MFGQSLLSAFGSAACTTDTDQLFTTDVQTTSVATYQLNNATTSIPSNTYPGTASNITYAAGKFGNAAVFNGSSSFIQTSLSTNETVVSHSLWFYADSVDSTNALYFFDNNGGRIDTFITGTGSNSVSNSLNSVNITATTALSQWNHLVIVYTGWAGSYSVGSYGSAITVTAYLNGSSIGTASPTPIGQTTGMRIGRSGGGYYFDGKIDQVRIFNTSLPQAAVTALYNETTTTATYPYIDYVNANPNSVAYYKMSDATDQLGNYNGTATNVNFNTEGKFGFAGAFNGSSSYIDLGNNSSNNSSTISVSSWFKTSGHSGTATIINNGGANSQETGYFLGLTSSGYLRFNATGVGSIDGSVNYADGNWHNVIMTLNNGAYNIYVDGNTTPVITGTGAFTSTATRPTWIGKFSHATANIEYFNGSIDQIRIYDSAISAANVTTLYNEVECPAVAVTNAFNTVLYTGNGTTQPITSLDFAPDLVWIKERTSTSGHHLGDSVRGATKMIYPNLTNAESTDVNTITSFDDNGFTVGSSGGVNQNSENYVAWNWKAPLANLSTSFNGSSSKITTNADFDGSTTQGGSISFWFKTSSSTLQIPIGSQTGFNGSSYGSCIYIGSQTSTFPDESLGFWQYDGSTAYSILVREGHTAYQNGDWFHCVITSTSTTKNIYINGVNKTVAYRSNTTSSTPFHLTDIQLGISLGTTNFMNGSIDQVRIFNTALSASEVSDLYAEPAASNNTLNYPAGAGCIAAYPLQTDTVDLSGNYNGTPSNVTFGQPGYLTENTEGTITSTVAANVDAGFSIVKYTGNGTNGATVGHGLSQAPELILTKGLSTAYNWNVVTSLLQNGYLELNTTSGFNSNSSRYITAGTTTNSLTNYVQFNQNNINHIAYCFHSVDGYSKFGSYDGDTSNPTFIYTGFRPAFVMIKATNVAQSWYMFDNKRGNTSGAASPAILFANDSAAEYTTNNSDLYMTFSDNGFQPATAISGMNGTGRSFIYMAIA